MPLRPSRRLVLAAAAFGALAACTQRAPSDAAGVAQDADARHVNVYTTRHYGSDQAVYRRFTEETGIEVRVLEIGGAELFDRLQTEGDQTAADLIVTVDGGALWRLAEAGMLQPLSTPALQAAAPARFRDPDNRWWAFAKRARVIVYNKESVDPVILRSMDDLAQARFRGQVCARSSANTYNLSMLAARIERAGADNARDWARGVVENFARQPQGADTEQIRAVAAGQCQVAISNHYYLLRLQNSDDPADREVASKVGVFIPDQDGAGAHVNISGAGVSAYSPRVAQATRLLEFLLSPESQSLFANLTNEFPVRPDVELTPGLAALGRFHEEQIPFEALGRRQAEAARIYEEVGWR
ncbi:MAG: extracellular solute-binding protein [Alphaproteobacteria bacterium]|nr:extracellular solute-binding protein [Alphaproteobacteria bacterium]